MRAAIMAGGMGRRLRPLTDNIPKALVTVNGMTMIERTIKYLEYAGVEEVVILVSKFKEIKDFLLKKKFNIKLDFIEKISKDMDDAFFYLHEKFPNEKFLIILVDLCFEKELLKEFLESSRGTNADFLVCVSNKVGQESKVLMNESNKVLAIGKKIPDWNFHNAGLYIASPIIFNEKENFLNKGHMSSTPIIEEFFVRKGYNVMGYVTNREVYEIDTPEELKVAEEFLRRVE